MKRSVPKILARVFYAVFTVLFSGLLIALFCGEGQLGYRFWALIPLTVLFLVTAVLIFERCKNAEALLSKKFPWIVVFSAVGMVSVQICLGLLLRFVPAWDLDAIYSGAIRWAETGRFADDSSYFQYFPNNLGGLTLLYLAFRPLHLLGGTDYFAAAVVFNSALLTSSMLLTVWAAKTQFGVPGGMFALLLFVASLPFYVLGAVFYTDALSMFPSVTAAGWWWSFRIGDAPRWNRNALRLRSICSGCAAVLGTKKRSSCSVCWSNRSLCWKTESAAAV